MSAHKILLTVVSAAMLSVGSALAATVTLEGDSVAYQYDTGTNSDALILFGTPQIQGDTVIFVPPEFRAESLNGADPDIVGAEFVFDRVYTNDGREIGTLAFVESGDYEITGSGSLNVDLLLAVINNGNTIEDELAFSADGGSTGLQNFQLDALLMPAMSLADPASDISVAIRNTLTAESVGAGDVAWVQKKLLLLTATPMAVPLPATAWMFFAGLGAFARFTRRLRH